MKNSIVIASVFMAALALTGCNKDSSDTTTTPSLAGLSITEVPPFVGKDIVLDFEADINSLYVSSGDMPTVGLYWQVNSAKKDTLTRDITQSNPVYKYSVDTLGTYNVTCYAYAGSNYYSTSATASFMAIDPAKVVTEMGADQQITAGGLTWLANNLNNGASGISLRKSPILDTALGRLYNWTEAQTACPAGWHLPSAADFYTSFGNAEGKIPAGSLMVDASFNGEKMWEYWPQVKITNSFGFNAVPTGYVDTTDSFNTYTQYGEYACWWTADNANDELGVYMYIHDEYTDVRKGTGDKNSLYMGVRCVKD